jgi:hypothetical protein
VSQDIVSLKFIRPDIAIVDQSLIAGHRGSSPVVFVSHRPNIDLLSLELIDEGELLVARANESGELTVLGKIQVQP